MISPSLIIRSWERIFETDRKNTKIYWRIIRWMLCKINIFIGFYTIKILIGKGDIHLLIIIIQMENLFKTRNFKLENNRRLKYPKATK
jgi:hypothetical protein